MEYIKNVINILRNSGHITLLYCNNGEINGISPMKWFDVVGKIANEDFLEDELIRI